MSLKDLILKNRSYRRFYHDHKISKQTLVELVDLARHSPSAKNQQPLKYYLIWEEEECNKVFPNLVWAAFLSDWKGPVEEERPSAYIIMLFDNNLKFSRFDDAGIAAQSILLGAVEQGLGGCIVAAVQKDKLTDILQIPDDLEIFYVVALGKPKEEIIIDYIEPDTNTNYWRDEKQVHHVPKRRLEDIILNF
jgi:nitroreductase